jgi:hypothetical protein
MAGKSWSFAHDRRVIELAKASKSLEEAADHEVHARAHSQSFDAVRGFIQSRS